ncbi:Uma2 family endonuclease [Streptomyces sp. PU-14G]|uniref:Uma2 family endonuclease n=1 Tax=Streptomyces sp. PU-14G TaxID=2800808 RepID=UPI0034E0512D
MDYARMREIAEELAQYSEQLEGTWNVEVGASGPLLMMMSPSKRHEGTVRRIREQLNRQLVETHPGYVCENGPEVEHPALQRIRRPDAVILPETVLDEEGWTVDATEVLAVIEIVSKSNPENDYREKMVEYPAMGIAHYLLVDPRKGTIEMRSSPEGNRYQHAASYIYGDPVTFGPWKLDTSGFRRYREPGE